MLPVSFYTFLFFVGQDKGASGERESAADSAK